MENDNVWQCRIGGNAHLPSGSDGPMREAVSRAFREVTGQEPRAAFTGWGERWTPAERHCLAPGRYPAPDATTRDGAKVLEELDQVIAIQCQPGNWNWDPYMHGMANGLLLARATLTGEDPVYLDAPPAWLCDGVPSALAAAIGRKRPRVK